MKKAVGMTPASVAAIVKECGFSPDEAELTSLAIYLEQVLKWNKVMNLIGPYTWDEALRSLMMDSLHLALFLNSLALPPAPCCWDFGAGAGLPGIPLRIVWQKGEYHLVEVREKRAMFMQQTVARLKLPHTYVFRGRAEDFMAGRVPADVLLSRAFMPWEKLLDFAGKNINSAGRIVVLALEPAPASPPNGWSVEAHRAYQVGSDTRYFWSLRPSNASI